MADLTVEYVLTTPGGTITFNDGEVGDGTDKFWIQAIQGLDGPAIRAPVDPVPFGDGGLVHVFWKGPRRVTIDGVLLIESPVDCQERRNVLSQALMDALDSIIQATGSLAWTPVGLSALSLSVTNEIPLNITYSDNFMLSNFSFGLVSESADPS